MYDIVACPKTSGGVTSGGDTGEARILGNGWESAQNQAKVDVTYVTYYEQEFLKKVIYICKENTDKVKDIYSECEMHDWWLTLVAAFCGKIVYIDEPLHLYRQHTNNTIGARRDKNIIQTYFTRMKKLFKFIH